LPESPELPKVPKFETRLAFTSIVKGSRFARQGLKLRRLWQSRRFWQFKVKALGKIE
jgi:hypothetical protein